MSDIEERGINRHPLQLRSPFRHAASKYIPLDRKQQIMLAKELWDQFGSVQTAVERVADYAVTGIDVKIEDDEDLGEFKTAKEARAAYEEIYNDIIDISGFMKRILIDQQALGSAIPYYNFKSRKKAYCPHCKKRSDRAMVKSRKSNDKDTKTIVYAGEWLDSMPPNSWEYSASSGSVAFQGKCPKCKKTVTFDVHEEKSRTKRDLKITLLDITKVQMDWIPLTNDRRYWYTPDDRTKRYVTDKNKWAIARIPMQVLEAIAANNGKNELIEGTFCHIADVSLTQSSIAWPMPTILRSFFSLFYIASLRAASESIAATQITPFTIIWPSATGAFGSNPGGMMFQKFRAIMEEEFDEWAQDPKHIWISPIPISFNRIGGDGKTMLPTQEMQYAWDDVFLAQGIPRGLLTGNITWAGNHIAMRIFQNGVSSRRTQIQRFINLLQAALESNLTYLPKAKITLKPFRELDDAWYKQLALSARGEGIISDQKVCEINDWDPDEMADQREAETKRRVTFESKLQMESAANEAKASAAYNKTLMAEQSGQMLDQMQQHVTAIVTVITDLTTKAGVTSEQAVQMFMAYQNEMAQINEMNMIKMKEDQAQQAFLDKETASSMQSINRAGRNDQLLTMMGQNPRMPGGEPPASSAFISVMQAIQDPAIRESIMSTLGSINPTLLAAVQGGMGQQQPIPMPGQEQPQN